MPQSGYDDILWSVFLITVMTLPLNLHRSLCGVPATPPPHPFLFLPSPFPFSKAHHSILLFFSNENICAAVLFTRWPIVGQAGLQWLPDAVALLVALWWVDSVVM